MKNISCYLARRILYCKFGVLLVAMILVTACSGGGSSSSVEITSPPVLSIKTSLNTFGQSRDVLIANDIVYVADGTDGLVVLRLTSQNSLEKIAQLPLQGIGRAYSLAKKDNFIFMAAREEGVYVIDVSVPQTPNLVKTLSVPNASRASYLEVSGNYLYVSADDNFIVFDITDSVDSVEAGSAITNSPNQHIVLSGNYAFVAGYQQGLRILDISNPVSPKTIAELDLNHTVISITKLSNTIFLGGVDGKVFVIDVSDVLKPDLTDILNLPDVTNLGQIEYSPYDLSIEGKFLYVADGDSGIQVINISNPQSPVIEKGVDTTGDSWAIAINGRNMLVADSAAGVHLIDIFETTDQDGDGFVDGEDAFRSDPSEWLDTDGDGIGNNADTDDDNDTVLDLNDLFPLDATEFEDTDHDGVGNNADAFPNNPAETADYDKDGLGDNADTDDDNDGLLDIDDVLPRDAYNLRQITFDANYNAFPKLDGNQIAWKGYTATNATTIYFQDLSTGTTIDLGGTIDLVLPDRSPFHGIPSLSNGQVAWRVWDKDPINGRYYIYLWDGTTTTRITDYSDGGLFGGFADKQNGYLPSFHSVDVQIENGTLAWAQWDGTDYEIMFWDGTTTYQITDNTENDYEPQLNNGQLAWTGDEANGSSFDVFFWDGVDPINPNIINISNNPDVPDEDAHLMNGTIAWSGYTTTEYKRDILFWDGTNITTLNLPGNDYEPQIDNLTGIITWNNSSSGIYLVHVWDGYHIETMDIAEMDGGMKSPFAYNGQIAFAGTVGSGGADIYIGQYRIDKDSDGVVNGLDAFPLDPSETTDTDRDGTGNNADLDDDNDGTPDTSDVFPLDSKEWVDSDGDGVGDNSDVFPDDNTEWFDGDIDGIGDNTDVIDEVTLSSIYEFDTTGQARGVLKDGNIIYVADGTLGVRIYQLSLDGSLTEIGLFALAGQAQSSARTLLKVGNYLYVTARSEGLYVLDVSDPANPVSVYNYDTLDMATFITRNGSTLYLSDRTGLVIFDISSPDAPVVLGDYVAPSEFEHIIVEDGIAYIAGYYTGLILLDVSDPASITELSRRNLGFALWAVEKQGNYVYVGGEGSGLIVLNVENPLNPAQVSTIPLPSVADPKPADQPPFDMEVHGDYLFVADGYSGLQVVNIADPLNPSIATSFDTAGYLWDFHFDGQTIVLGDYLSGIQLLNLGASFDLDSDGVPNYLDQSPTDAAGFVDVDYDGIDNTVDTDDDNDGVLDVDDAFPLEWTESVDTDGDGTGNNADLDDDGDGRTDATDTYPLDTDNDGVDNDLDTDDDNDGVVDTSDVFPLDEYEWEDLDSDGIGDNHPTNRYATIDTSMGVIKLELLEDVAPLTTANLIRLAESGFYDGLIFHRVIDTFMIQGGDPNGNGTGGPGYAIVDEFPVDNQGALLATHSGEGILSMANSGPNTGGSQFFITLAAQPHLDGVHTVFGSVVQGLTVLQSIGAVATDTGDKPLVDVVINTITITDI